MPKAKTRYDYRPVEGRPAATFDADGTLFDGYSIYPVFDYFADQGFIDAGANQEYQQILLNYQERDLDYPDFVHAGIAKAAIILDEHSASEAEGLAKDYFANHAEWFPYAESTVTAYREADIATVLVTAEPSFIGKAIADVLGLDMAISSQLTTVGHEFENGQIDEVLSSDVKGAYLAQLEAAGCTIIAAYGDSIGDKGMLERAKNAYCIKPSEDLRNIAADKSWTVIENPAEHTGPIVPVQI